MEPNIAIEIDPDFCSLVPPLTTEERAQLEANLLADGCREPLVTWNGKLLDGHNRHEICQRHGIKFEVTEKQFPTKEDAVNWIVDNQLGRRNLTPEARLYLLGKKYNAEKAQGARNDLTSAQNEQKLTTAEKLAEQYHVAGSTVRRAGHFADSVDAVAANVGAEFKQKVLSGAVDCSQKDMEILASKPPEAQRAIAAKLESGEAERLPDAIYQANRDEQRRKLVTIASAARPLTMRKKYAIILADFPWKYNARANHLTRFRGGASGHYPLMTMEEIRNFRIPTSDGELLSIADIAADDAMFYMWCTHPLIEAQLALFAHFGFKLKTIGFDWTKLNPVNKQPCFGNGFYTKSNPEPCYFGTRGNVLRPAVDTVSCVVQAVRREHSRKPDEVYEGIEAMYPGLPKIELFARGEGRAGWDQWGYEAAVDGSEDDDAAEMAEEMGIDIACEPVEK